MVFLIRTVRSKSLFSTIFSFQHGRRRYVEVFMFSISDLHLLNLLTGSIDLLLDPSSPEIVSLTLTTLINIYNMHWRRLKHVLLKDTQLTSRYVDFYALGSIILRQWIRTWLLDLLWILWQSFCSTTMFIRLMPRYPILPTHFPWRTVPHLRAIHPMCLSRHLWEPKEWFPRERWLVQLGHYLNFGKTWQ